MKLVLQEQCNKFIRLLFFSGDFPEIIWLILTPNWVKQRITHWNVAHCRHNNWRNSSPFSHLNYVSQIFYSCFSATNCTYHNLKKRDRHSVCHRVNYRGNSRMDDLQCNVKNNNNYWFSSIEFITTEEKHGYLTLWTRALQ